MFLFVSVTLPSLFSSIWQVRQVIQNYFTVVTDYHSVSVLSAETSQREPTLESGYKTKFGVFLTWQAPLRHNIQTLILSCTWIIDRFFREEIPWELFWCLQRDSTPSERGHFRRGFTSPREEATQPPPAGFSPTGPSAANTLWLARWPPLPRPAQASRVTWPHGPS